MSQNTYPPNDEINLIQLFSYLKTRKKFVLLVMSAITLAAIIYCIFATPYYGSYVSIYPTVDENAVGSNFGDIQGIASAIGLNIDGMEKVTFYIPDIVESRMLRKAVILKKWDTDKYDQPVNLITYWGIDDTTKLTRRLKKIIGKLLPHRKADPQKKYIEEALNELTDLLFVKEEDSGLTVIKVLIEEPQLASDIGNFVAQYIKDYIRMQQGARSRKYRIFVEDRLNDSKNELAAAEDKLTDFRKKHPLALDTPDLQLRRGRLLRDVEVNQEVYITLRQQFELASIEELKETAVINILDEAEPSVEITKPKRLLIITVSILGGFVLSLILLSFSFTFSGENVKSSVNEQ